MNKALTQIMFDFSAPAEEPAIPVPEPVVKTVPRQPMPPVVVSSEPEPEKAKRAGARKTSTRGRKSLKDMNTNTDLLKVPEDEILFQKQYYSIGEVAGMLRENQSLIRYWETEFDILQPRKNRKGDRFFRPVDIKNLVLIYDLLRRRKFTIEGAKDFLKKGKKAEERFAAIQSLQKIKAFLLELKANL